MDGYIDMEKERGIEIEEKGVMEEGEKEGGEYVMKKMISDVNEDNSMEKEEIFGKVKVIMNLEKEEEEIENGKNYGIVCGIWKNDGGRKLRIENEIN